MKIYLAGTMSSNWRDTYKSFNIYNPMTDTKQGAIIEFVGDDINAIDSCDIILCYGTGDIGASAEIGFALGRNKFVVLVLHETEVPHPFLLGLARRVFISHEQAKTWLTKLLDRDEFTAIYETMKEWKT